MKRSLIFSCVFVAALVTFHYYKQIGFVLRTGSIAESQENRIARLASFIQSKKSDPVNMVSRDYFHSSESQKPEAIRLPVLTPKSKDEPLQSTITRPDLKITGILPGDSPVAFVTYQGKNVVAELGSTIGECSVISIQATKVSMTCSGTSFEYTP